MSRDIFREVVHSNPIDRTARAVVQRGTSYDFVIPKGAVHSVEPLAMRGLPANLKSRIGERMGRFTVIGFMWEGNPTPVWCVRCSCGRYEVRDNKALNRRLRNPDLPPAMCLYCIHMERLRSPKRKKSTPRPEPFPGMKWCGTKGCTKWIQLRQVVCRECDPKQVRGDK